MRRIGTLIAVVSLLMLAAMTDVVLAQSPAPAPATGSFKGTYSGDVSDGGGAGTIRTSSQGSDSKEPAKPAKTSPQTSFQETYTASPDAGTKSKR
jgi:hypothetical protein